MKNTRKKTRQSAYRARLESDVLDAYNLMRKEKPQPSTTECYSAVGQKYNMNYYQVQYIVIKARESGKKVV